MQLEGRTVLITGGSSGIGRALVERFLALDCTVVTCSRHGPAPDEAQSPRLCHLRLDLASPEGRRALLTELRTRYVDLSLLINNAGVQHLVDFTTAPMSHIEATSREEIALNLEAPLLLGAALLPLLREQPEAAIVNITTGLALAPKKSSPVYCASKAALRSFTRSFRYQVEEVAPRVRVVEALPPLVDTRMTTGRGSGKLAPADVAEALVAGLRAGRDEICIGKTRLLKLLMRLSPALVYRILRTW
ncbi:SDR family oxidoreductase [Derxia gummosa]|uniref:SDR family oxidoreductase n=1 Tax=Derxia gummosa DSM 723 TaxID=1121388 RepID=A0A8B6X575_9BURK|nr:SDR family NAD(P)-dependent oxidoreductase [Derxia gummosa]